MSSMLEIHIPVNVVVRRIFVEEELRVPKEFVSATRATTRMDPTAYQTFNSPSHSKLRLIHSRVRFNI